MTQSQSSTTDNSLDSMNRLEGLNPGALRGVLPASLVTVVGIQWFGSEALELTYKTSTGNTMSRPERHNSKH